MSRFTKTDWLNQAGFGQQPYLETRMSEGGDPGQPHCQFRCLLCLDGTDGADAHFMTADEVVAHLVGGDHRGKVKEALRQALPALRDESCLDDPLSLPFCRMGHNHEQANRFEFTCLTCRTKGMPLGVFLSHCHGFRHAINHRDVCRGLGVGIADADDEPLSASRRRVASALSPSPRSVLPAILQDALVHQPYLAQQELQKGVFVWECLLCAAPNLTTTDELARHLQSSSHERRRQELAALMPREFIELERIHLSNGREEYCCKLCGTKPMIVDRLGFHYNGVRHRDAFRKSMTECSAIGDHAQESQQASPEFPSCMEEDAFGADVPVDPFAFKHSATLTPTASSDEPTTAETALSPLPSFPTATALHSSPLAVASAGADALAVLAKVEKCRTIQVQIAPLPDSQKHHVNHLLLQHVLCDEEPTQGVFLSLATVYVNDYLSQLPSHRADRQPEAASMPPTVDASHHLHESNGTDASMSTFRQHLPKDSYLSPTVMKSVASVAFDDDAQAPPVMLDIREVPKAPSSTSSTTASSEASAQPTHRLPNGACAAGGSTVTSVIPRVFDSPHLPRKKRPSQDCFPCTIL